MPLPIVIAVGIFALAVAALWPKKAGAATRQEEKTPGVPSDTKQIVKAEIEATKQAGVLPPIIPPPKTAPDEPSGHLIQVKPEKVVVRASAKKELSVDDKQAALDQAWPLIEAGRASKAAMQDAMKLAIELGDPAKVEFLKSKGI